MVLDSKDKSAYIGGMNKLPLTTRSLILKMLCEGQSIRATARLADVSYNTVAKLLVDAGKVCADLHDELLQDVTARRIQCDEVWSFTYAKQKNVASAKAAPDEAGDTWTWTALDSDSKLIVSWLVGGRDGEYAIAFMDDLRARLANRVQLTTDGHRAYLEAVEGAFGGDVDYAQLVKLYGEPTGQKGHERKYSPSVCTGAKKRRVEGSPDPAYVSTSHVERQNLTMRMQNAPFHAADLCVLKEVREPHAHGCALHRLVQLHPHPQVAARDPGHGSGFEQDSVGHGRPGADHGRVRAEARPAQVPTRNRLQTEALPPISSSPAARTVSARPSAGRSSIRADVEGKCPSPWTVSQRAVHRGARRSTAGAISASRLRRLRHSCRYIFPPPLTPRADVPPRGPKLANRRQQALAA